MNKRCQHDVALTVVESFGVASAWVLTSFALSIRLKSRHLLTSFPLRSKTSCSVSEDDSHPGCRRGSTVSVSCL